MERAVQLMVAGEFLVWNRSEPIRHCDRKEVVTARAYSRSSCVLSLALVRPR